MNGKLVYNLFGRIGFLYDACLSLTGYKKSVDFFVDEFIKETGFKLKLILDAGCGTGQYSMAVLRKFPDARIVAFDFQEAMVNRTQKNLQRENLLNRADLFTDDITGPMSKISRLFDAIIVSGVLEYTPPEITIKKLSKLLRPGGYFLHVPVRNTLWGKIVGVLYRFKPYPQKKIISAFTENKLKLIRIVTLSPLTMPFFKEAHIFQK